MAVPSSEINLKLESDQPRTHLGSKAPWPVRACIIGISACLFLSALFYVLPQSYRFDFWTPHFECSEPIFDFGTAKAGTTIHHEFTVTNSGRNCLKLVGMAGDCSCIGATVSVQELSSGETGQVTAVLSLRGKHGLIDQTLYVLTNDPKFPRATLKIRGTVLSDYEVSDYVIPLSSTTERTRSATISIKGRKGAKPFRILEVNVRPRDYIEVTTNQVAEAQYSLTIRLMEDVIEKKICKALIVTDNSEEHEIILDVLINTSAIPMDDGGKTRILKKNG